jgi:ribonuclease Z
MIEVTLLGTGSPIPDARRAGPSTLVRAGGQTFLVDCGRGVQQRMTAAGVGANGLTALLLTHLHSDHIADLGDVIITRWVTTFDTNPSPLPIIEPLGTAEVVDATLKAVSTSATESHHGRLTSPPPVEFQAPTVWCGTATGDDPGGADGSPARRADHRIPHRTRRRLGGAGR